MQWIEMLAQPQKAWILLVGIYLHGRPRPCSPPFKLIRSRREVP